MKPLTKTLKLLLVSQVASLGFGIIAGAMFEAENIEEFLSVTIIFLPVALGFEVWVYKAFLKNWRDVLMNYAIAHFAAFFSIFGVIIGWWLEIRGFNLILPWLLVWMPLAYLGQYHIIYVERLEEKNKKQQQEIERFESKRELIKKQMKMLQAKINHEKQRSRMRT